MRMWMCEQSMMELREALEGPLQAASFGRKKGVLQTFPQQSSTNSSRGQALRSAKCCTLCCKSDTGHFSCNCCNNSISQILQYPFYTWGNRLWSLLQGYQTSTCLKLKSKHSFFDSETCSETKNLQQRLGCQSSQNLRKEQRVRCDTENTDQTRKPSAWRYCNWLSCLRQGNLLLLPDRMFSGPTCKAQLVKNLPAMWEMGVQPLGRKDPLEMELVIHSSILAWRIPGTE